MTDDISTSPPAPQAGPAPEAPEAAPPPGPAPPPPAPPAGSRPRAPPATASALGDRRGLRRLARRQRHLRAGLAYRLADREAVAQQADRHPQRLTGPRPSAARPDPAAAEHHLVAGPGAAGVLP